MFTNWLTGTTSSNNRNSGNLNSSLGENRSVPNSALVTSTNSNFLTNHAGHILMSTPPDVVLEVGPAPNTVRFVAHSIVLGMHSGYLRSAIRLDEHILNERTAASSSSTSASNLPEFVLFLGNVTAEQFAPLLTYMYTGYLDLNVENIFGVLLATHVLHMPRALEICRAFLSRAQTDGYLGARLANSNLPSSSQAAVAANLNSNNKIIRPIPSKATMPHFGFLPTTAIAAPAQPPPPPPQPLPTAQQQPIMMSNFKNLQRHHHHHHQNHQVENAYHQQTQLPTQLECEKITNELNQNKTNNERAKSEEIDVDQESIKASSENDENKSDKDEILIKVHSDEHFDDEDEEVFIDSSDDIDNSDNDIDDDNEMEVIIEVKSSNRHKPPKQMKNIATVKSKDEKTKNSKTEKSHKKVENSKKESGTANSVTNSRHQQTKRRSNKVRSGLQIAKAPIPASQLDVNEGSKVIIDVASCDGPVRFRRILNTAYGHKPSDFTAQMPERSQQSVSYSFHQQMARTIHHQQQQQQQQHRQQLQQQSALGEESENSESSGGGGGGGGSSNKHSKSNNQISANEIYVCVYCKHTFKSQYCYQKHAKRHLNPLSLNPSDRCDNKTTGAALAVNNLSFNATPFGANATGNGAGGVAAAVTGGGVGGGGLVGNSCLPLPLLATKQNANDLLRREVRPLDMNVQYYPCKTCGSKFPSYYFVHKHRKLCHADEELNIAVVEKSKSGNTTEDITKDQKSNAPNTLDLKTNSDESNHDGERKDAVDEQQQVKHEHS